MSQPLPDAIRTLMQDLAAGLHAILGTRLVGLYLGGSLAMGDYCEVSSDLDFLAVTEGALSPEDQLAVGMLHRDLLRLYPNARQLEGDYAPRHTLIPAGTTAPVPGCERGRFLPRVGEIMLSADNVYNMREHGITFFGPHPAEVLPQVTTDEVRLAVRAMLEESAAGCQTPEEAADELLNLCRSLCALETGLPTTKSEGAAWALKHLEDRWHPLIAAAVAVRCQGHAGWEGQELCTAVRELDLELRGRFLAR